MPLSDLDFRLNWLETARLTPRGAKYLMRRAQAIRLDLDQVWAFATLQPNSQVASVLCPTLIGYDERLTAIGKRIDECSQHC